MKVTINGVTYEGTENEIRRIVENPPNYWGRPNQLPLSNQPGAVCYSNVSRMATTGTKLPNEHRSALGKGFPQKLGWFSQGDLLHILNELWDI